MLECCCFTHLNAVSFTNILIPTNYKFLKKLLKKKFCQFYLITAVWLTFFHGTQKVQSFCFLPHLQVILWWGTFEWVTNDFWTIIKVSEYTENRQFRYYSFCVRKKFTRVLSNIKMSKQWQNFHFWLNNCFKNFSESRTNWKWSGLLGNPAWR